MSIKAHTHSKGGNQHVNELLQQKEMSDDTTL